MPSKPFLAVVALLVTVAAVAPAVIFGLEHAQLTRRVARQREFTEFSRRLANENRSLQELVAKTSGDTDSARARAHAELEAARRELAELEQRAGEQRTTMVAQATRDAEALASNRDPRRGLMRLEFFADVGQATPDAAFQTLGWAILHRPERVPSLLALAPEARTKAAALIAALPAEAQAKWTPEKLAELWITGALTHESAFQVAEVKPEAGGRATLVLRAPSARSDAKLTMELGPDGWRLLIEERAVGAMKKLMAQTAEPR